MTVEWLAGFAACGQEQLELDHDVDNKEDQQARVPGSGCALGIRSRSWSRVSAFSSTLVSPLTILHSASGFTTRSDIGPAREGPSAEVVAYVRYACIGT